MSCDFKVGDELVYVGPGNGKVGSSGLALNSAHVCRAVIAGPLYRVAGVKVDARVLPIKATSFRKVQRRDLTAWLATENTIEGPLRTKEHAR